MLLNFLRFESWIFRKVFLNIERVTASENQRIIFKSLLISYFIIKHNKVEQNNKKLYR